MSVRRFRSEDDFLLAVEARAKHIWAEREKAMPSRVQQTWEQGSWAARRATLAMARADILNMGRKEITNEHQR